MSRRTQDKSSLWRRALIVGVLLFSAPAWSKGGAKFGAKLNEAQSAFEESQKQLDAAHGDYFEGINRYFEAASSPGSSPEAVEEARKSLAEVDSRIAGIQSANLERARQLITSTAFVRNDDGTVTMLDKSELPPELDEGEGSKDDDAAPGRADPVIGSGSSDSSGKDKKDRAARSSAEPTPEPTLESPALTSGDGPRLLVFKKRPKPSPSPSASPSPSPSASSTPTPRPSPRGPT